MTNKRGYNRLVARVRPKAPQSVAKLSMYLRNTILFDSSPFNGASAASSAAEGLSKDLGLPSCSPSNQIRSDNYERSKAP